MNASTNVEKIRANVLTREIRLFKRLNDKKKEIFYDDLKVLLEAGVDLKSAIEIIIDEQVKEEDKMFFMKIYDEIIIGTSFADALRQTKEFSDYEYYSIRIGEESNQLSTVLNELALYFGEKVALKKQIISVLSYPGFVFLITIGIVYFMLGSIVPMFSDVFKQFGSELPSLTKKIIYLSDNFMKYLVILIAIISMISVFVFYQKDKIWFRKHLTFILLKLPLVKGLISKIYLTRFVQSLHLLLSSKTPLIKSLDLTQKMIKFYPLEQALLDIKNKVTKGLSLNEVMKDHSIFPKRLVSLVKVGEEVNQLENMLAKVAKQYSNDLKHETNIIGKIMEPLILLIIGSVVGVILVAMYLPMFNLSNLMAQ